MDNIHDKYLKAQLMKIENAMAFLGSTLPNDMIRLLELSSLSISPNSYLTGELKELFADIVYDCRLADGNDSYCTVLLEHKSYRDPHTTFQLGSYIFEG